MVRVQVLQDGESLDETIRGEDVVFEPDGRSVVKVSEPRSYCLIQNADIEDHTVSLVAGSDAFACYSFSFVSAAIPETISGT
jgi:hypothetical protein